MRCFINEDGLIGHLNIYHVTKHLLSLTAKESSIFDRNKLALEYLWIVVPHMNTSQPPEFNLAHTLAMMYVETLRDLLQTNPEDERISQMRSRLQSLLKTNQQCIPEELLKELPADLKKEQCVRSYTRNNNQILLARLHRHQEALRLILPDLEDAYHYCDEVIRMGNQEDGDVYLILLGLQEKVT